MASLSSLPRELLDDIIDQMSQGDLSSISQVNRYLHHVVEPLLYSKISWLVTDLKPEDPPIFPILPLICTLIHRPDLARQIEYLQFRGGELVACCKHPETVDLMATPKTRTQIEQCVKFATDHLFPSLNEWKNWIEFGSMDALLGLLIWQLPNLRNLDLHHAIWNNFNFVRRVFSFALRSENPLPGLTRYIHLESVDIERDYRWRSGVPEDTSRQFFPFPHLPAIQRLVCSQDELRQDERYGEGDIRTWDDNLKISDSLISFDVSQATRRTNLSSFIAIIPALQKLRLTIDMVDNIDFIDCDGFQMVVSNGPQSLEEICLTIKVYGCPKSGFALDQVDLYGSLSFASLKSIRMLELPQFMLFGSGVYAGFDWVETRLVNVLPASLEHLSLTCAKHRSDEEGKDYCWDEGILQAFKEWLEGEGPSKPKLTKLTLSRVTYEVPQEGEEMILDRGPTNSWPEIQPILDIFRRFDIETEVLFGAPTWSSVFPRT